MCIREGARTHISPSTVFFFWGVLYLMSILVKLSGLLPRVFVLRFMVEWFFHFLYTS